MDDDYDIGGASSGGGSAYNSQSTGVDSEDPFEDGVFKSREITMNEFWQDGLNEFMDKKITQMFDDQYSAANTQNLGAQVSRAIEGGGNLSEAIN